MSKIITYITLLLLACFLTSSIATPIKDVSTTTIDIENDISPDSERFVVTVNRIDDLLDDDDSLLGERVIAVMMHFDLQDDHLRINNVPVELNKTSLEIIQAEIATGDKSIAEIEKSFDIGLLTVEVSTLVEALPSEYSNIDVRRITISARIIEVDGKDVIQTEAIERIMEVKVHNVLDDDQEDGELISIKDGQASVDANNARPKHSQINCPFKARVNRIRQWWRSTSRFTRIVIASMGFTAVFGILFILVPTAIKYCHSRTRYEVISYNPDDEDVTQIIFVADDEKQEPFTNGGTK